MEAMSARDFVLSVFRQSLLPENPIIPYGWAGIAFDRNRYEDLAPSDVWNAWFDVNQLSEADKQGMEVISFSDLSKNKDATIIHASLVALRCYWEQDARFLQDHYVISVRRNWLIRLDQDVTLFAAKANFLSKVVNKLGGLEGVMDCMRQDFSPGPLDRVGLESFLCAITAPIKAPGE